jgi:F-type H+-transporting ATPase subunit epsilon
MADELNLEIITPNSVKYSGEVKSVTVSGVMGNFQVLKNHAPIISVLDIGEVKVEKLNDENIHYAACGGTIEVLKNNVLLLLDAIEAVGEIDIERAKKSREEAEDILRNKADMDMADLEEAGNALKRAVNRLKLVEKHIKAD